MKKTIITLSILTSGGVFANEQCYDIIPDGPIQELNTPKISMLGNGNIYANSVMQAQVKVDYEVSVGFSLDSVTLCDAYTMIPLQEEQLWEVSQHSNGYLHEIITSSSQAEEYQFFPSNWAPKNAVRYLSKANNIASSIEVCAVVSGRQSNGETIAKTTCLGDHISSVPITALSTPTIEFELVKNEFRDTKHHRAFVYELHTKDMNANFREIKYSSGAIPETNSVIRVDGHSSHLILKDTQYLEAISSWIGVWAYDAGEVTTVEMINEVSNTIGNYSIAPVSQSPSLLSTYLSHQIHRASYMDGDYFCEYSSIQPDPCINYSGTKNISSSPDADRLSNSVTLIDDYGTEHQFKLRFGIGDDDDDLSVSY
ncbi:hypothetical protein [Psychromonas sp. Urea-02u-13]|uniref:hypothetical protein n=1 Tax=Psychromonas sp. Urea-02u-13 TaxID=2058326 RepID=UPI000C335547|nr:hypothetical protein [Psychromonas sp. Urea-02u-13]PKG37063.1 hypothetical protein CXF74_20865 [Psychromonas sp. Urea-02u-13]